MRPFYRILCGGEKNTMENGYGSNNPYYSAPALRRSRLVTGAKLINVCSGANGTNNLPDFMRKKKIRLMRSWWVRARCILITARLRSTGKAALQRIRSRQITSAPKRSNICSKRRKKPRTRRCLSLRCGCFPCRTRNGRIRWYSRAG